MQLSTSSLRRYGPLALIAVLLVVVGAVVVLGGGDDEPSSAGSSGRSDEDTLGVGGEPGAPEPTGQMPLTYAEADDAGTVDDHEWGERCDPETGKVRVPSVYALPCVPVFDGDNGGATSDGVTEDTIKIVRYQGDPSSDLAAMLSGAGANNSPEQQSQTFQDYFEIYTSRAELYGRTIEYVDYEGTGAGDDVVAAKADATQIATELKPFLVIGGPQLDRGTFASELVSHGIVCVDCAGALPADMMADLEPYVWGSLPTADQFVGALSAWLAKFDEEVGGTTSTNAAFAGESLQDMPRKVGVIHFDQDPPLFEVPEDQVPEGVEMIESYILDFGTLPQKASELVAKFKSADITTVIFLGDPLMPIYLTGAASDQGWEPEWIFSGTVFTDTNLFGRQYDPAQMEHAFGISQLAAPMVQDLQTPIRVYRWYFGADEMPPASALYGPISAQAGLAVSGLHMAGPELTPETFARGMFRIPPTGGGPTTPQVSFGNWGFFDDVDYFGIDDNAEIWWDPSVSAPDEAGNPGQGVWRRAHGGQRFATAEDAPLPAPFVDPEDTVTVLDQLPDEDTPPDYPPPPGSPAAG